MGAIKKRKQQNAPSAGGAASARGNLYQQKAAAWWLTRVLTQNTTIGAAFGLSSGVMPVRILDKRKTQWMIFEWSSVMTPVSFSNANVR
jgi:hypothetical protein